MITKLERLFAVAVLSAFIAGCGPEASTGFTAGQHVKIRMTGLPAVIRWPHYHGYFSVRYANKNGELHLAELHASEIEPEEIP